MRTRNAVFLVIGIFITIIAASVAIVQFTFINELNEINNQLNNYELQKNTEMNEGPTWEDILAKARQLAGNK
jgi:predicted PurR-regulated permease PerM